MATRRQFAFVTLFSTGSDARVDRVFRLSARVPRGDGRTTTIDWLANPACDADPASHEAISARIHRIYGLAGRDFHGRSPADVVFPEFRDQLADRVIIGFEREELLRWWLSLEEADARRRGDSPAVSELGLPVMVGIADLARLCLPGRRSAGREELLRLVSGEIVRRGEPTPEELEQLLAAVCRAFLSKSHEELVIASCGFAHALKLLRQSDPAAAATLEASLDILDRPDGWRCRDAHLFPIGAELDAGLLSARAGGAEEALIAFASAKSRMAATLEDHLPQAPVADAVAAPVSLTSGALRMMDDIFQELLPREFSKVSGGSDPRDFYRKSQHELARRIAGALSGSELLLIDAPTGTGKTMSYLIPALLWAWEAKTRVGISTYTIALQEQVFDRELPRALLLLKYAGATEAVAGLRVSVLKGRERYLCHRALELAAPDPSDDAASWIAWTTLAIFALDDPEGDLDRVSRKFALWMEHGRQWEARFLQLLREVRCRQGCCETNSDRKRCGAFVARRRAERSHIVVTNHAFILRDPLFLRNIILDECDHVHAQARGASGIELSFKTIRDDVEAVCGPPAGGASRNVRGILAKLERARESLFPTGDSATSASMAAARREGLAAHEAQQGFERALKCYLQFQRDLKPGGPVEPHLGFQHFVSGAESGAEIRAARKQLTRSLTALSGLCRELGSSLEQIPVAGGARLRSRLSTAASDLEEHAARIGSWLPMDGDEFQFDKTCYYDFEEDSPRGASHPVAKQTILLPNRWLAERYYSSMQSVVLLSASTWLQGGFDLSRGYLGLDLVAEGSASADPRPVATHRAPLTFDYSRVLLTIPEDAPESTFGNPNARAAFERYLEQFISFLVERTRGRTLILLTNLQQCRVLGRALEARLRNRHIPFFWQGMDGRSKEELPRLFRSSEGGVLMGVDTFWYGVDFPGDQLEYLVIAKLPFGALDRYTRAQEAAIGRGAYQQTIYLPEALAMFRQGFGRLMRRETDRGAVFLLDPRVLSRWRRFLKELPGTEDSVPEEEKLKLFTGATAECIQRALVHCGRIEECRRLGLDSLFQYDASARDSGSGAF